MDMKINTKKTEKSTLFKLNLNLHCQRDEMCLREMEQQEEEKE